MKPSDQPPEHPDARKLLTSLPEGRVREQASRFITLYEGPGQWRQFAALNWVGAVPGSLQRQYGPAVMLYGLHLAHAVEVRAKTLGVPCAVWKCLCGSDCGKWFVMPAACYREGGHPSQAAPPPFQVPDFEAGDVDPDHDPDPDWADEGDYEFSDDDDGDDELEEFAQDDDDPDHTDEDAP